MIQPSSLSHPRAASLWWQSLQPWLPKSFTSFGPGYTRGFLLSDVLSGLTVGVVALPLAMAFAIASGITPERGLYTAIVAGFLISLLSGSRFQIGGPTGAFVVILFGVASRHGYAGLQVATVMAGVLLVLMGVFRFGAMLKFIPFPVVTGFTTGIAAVILSSQIKDLLGLSMGSLPAGAPAQWVTYWEHLGTVNSYALGVAAVSLGVILFSRHLHPRLPGPMVAVVVVSLGVWWLKLPVETIGSRFGSIPSTLPSPSLPSFGLEQMRLLLPEAFTIALLAGIESLLCAVVADGMTGDRHNSNTELLAQGVANIVSVCFGGIAATGALARTATNIRAGARSPLSGMIHAGVLLLIMWVAAPLATAIPMATLAAILVVVAFNMAELDHFRRMFKAPRSDALVMIVTFLLTVAVDLTLAVQVGVVLAALLFMRRMMEVTSITSARPFPLEHPGEEEGDLNPMSGLVIPEGVELFEINGPFFFGVADRLKDVMDTLEAPPRVFILRMRHVPAMDATGLSALAEFHDKCRRGGTWLVLSGVNPQPAHAMKKSGLLQNIGVENVTLDILHALTRAQTLMTSPERASD